MSNTQNANFAIDKRTDNDLSISGNFNIDTNSMSSKKDKDSVHSSNYKQQRFDRRSEFDIVTSSRQPRSEFPMPKIAFLNKYSEFLLDEELLELNEDDNPIETIYYAGLIP